MQLRISNRPAFLDHPHVTEGAVGVHEPLIVLTLDHIRPRRPGSRLFHATALWAVRNHLIGWRHLRPNRRDPRGHRQASGCDGQARQSLTHHDPCLLVLAVMGANKRDEPLFRAQPRRKKVISWRIATLIAKIPRAGSTSPRRRQAAISVLRSKQAIVIGPAPPGTGVIAPAIWRTAAKSTSPTSRLAPSGSETALI